MIDITSLMHKHGWDLPAYLWLEGRTRLYEREFVRTCIRPFSRPDNPEKWVFPIGCYNSGTTITQALLAAHPDISSLPKEGARFTSVLPTPEDLGWTRMWVRCQEHMEMGSEPDPRKAARVRSDWAPWLDRSCLAHMDKSISNVTRVGWLENNFDNAYFIGIVRDGYCVSEGIRRKGHPRKAPAQEIGNSYSIQMAGKQWVAANERVLEAAHSVERFMMIKYEDLIGDSVRTLAAIWEFLGLAAPQMETVPNGLIINGQRFHLEKNNDTQSHARLSAEDIDRLTPVIGDMQQQLGYQLLD